VASVKQRSIADRLTRILLSCQNEWLTTRNCHTLQCRTQVQKTHAANQNTYRVTFLVYKRNTKAQLKQGWRAAAVRV